MPQGYPFFHTQDESQPSSTHHPTRMEPIRIPMGERMSPGPILRGLALLGTMPKQKPIKSSLLLGMARELASGSPL